MPVNNVPTQPTIDLSPLAPLTLNKFDAEALDLEAGVNSGSYIPTYTSGGEIVNTANPAEEAIVYVLPLPKTETPAAGDVVSSGAQIYPGGSYQFLPRADLRYWMDMNTGSARVVCHSFGSV